MSDKRPSKSYRSNATSTAARPSSESTMAKTADAAATPLAYETLPALLREWPNPPAVTSKPPEPLLEERRWLETFGKQAGIPNLDAVQRMTRAGHLPAIRVGDLPEGIYPVAFADSVRRKIVIVSDPQLAEKVRADPGPLRAVVFASEGGHPVRIPTSVKTGLYATEEAHAKASQEAIAEAAKSVPQRHDVWRIAWCANRDGQELVRLVDYRDSAGARVQPGRYDMEAKAAAFDRTPSYNTEMMRADTARALAEVFRGSPRSLAYLAAADAPQPGQAASPATLPPAGAAPVTPRAEIAAAPAPRETAQPSHAESEQPGSSPTRISEPARVPAMPTATGERTTSAVATGDQAVTPDQMAMAQTRSFDPTVPPRRNQAHVIILAKDMATAMEMTKEPTLRRHAGIPAYYASMLPKGYRPQSLKSRQGAMEPGARVVLAVRSGGGTGWEMLAHMPYGGLEPKGSAATLLGHWDKATRIANPAPLELPDYKLPNPAYPLVIAPDTQEDILQYPADARRKMAEIVANTFGWA